MKVQIALEEKEVEESRSKIVGVEKETKKWEIDIEQKVAECSELQEETKKIEEQMKVEEGKKNSKKTDNEFQLVLKEKKRENEEIISNMKQEIGNIEKTLSNVEKELEDKTNEKEEMILKKEKEAKVKKASDDLDRQLEEIEEAIKEVEKELRRGPASAGGGSKRTPLKE